MLSLFINSASAFEFRGNIVQTARYDFRETTRHVRSSTARGSDRSSKGISEIRGI